MATYAYCRVSTTTQADYGESLQAQQQRIQGRAAMDGWALDAIFIERGVSGGKPLATRPEGVKLLSTLRPGDRVICSNLDRMFRSASDALAMLDHFKSQSISLHLLDLGGDDCTGNGISSLIFTVLAAVAEFERGRNPSRHGAASRNPLRCGAGLG